MKTTIEIPDALFRTAKQYAARQGIPVREVFERGLQLVLQKSPRGGKPFRLKTITTTGDGLACNADWSNIRSMIYKGRGG
jgi:hypothetical protein